VDFRFVDVERRLQVERRQGDRPVPGDAETLRFSAADGISNLPSRPWTSPPLIIATVFA
jgi:hypothetical protein